MNHIQAFIRALRSKRMTTDQLAAVFSQWSPVRTEIMVVANMNHVAINDIIVAMGPNEDKLTRHSAVFDHKDREQFAQRLEAIMMLARKYRYDFQVQMHLEIERSIRRMAWDIENAGLDPRDPKHHDPANIPDNLARYIPYQILQEYGTPFDEDHVSEERLNSTEHVAYQIIVSTLSGALLSASEKEIPLELRSNLTKVQDAARLYATFQMDRAMALSDGRHTKLKA